jgi:tRNA (cytosine38-C5)-methyltransferase
LDNRNKGIFYLMEVLLKLRSKPRWIVLENVAAFAESQVFELLKQVLGRCGYSFKSYLLSPVHFGVPNHRLRCYLIAEYGHRLESLAATLPFPSESTNSPRFSPIGRYLLPADTIPRELYLSVETLSASWAGPRISVTGQHDTTTYCFTKGYGRIFDKSTGSCLLIDAEGPLSHPDFAIDRSKMAALAGRVRLFHPDELLSMFGFPPEFKFPAEIPMRKQLACIGNSVNINVVRAVMEALFE